MKAMVLGLVLTAGCAGFTPADALEEFTRGTSAALALYHSECDGREESPQCVVIREHYNHVHDWLTGQAAKAAK